jgi:hypothetical protein
VLTSAEIYFDTYSILVALHTKMHSPSTYFLDICGLQGLK